MQRAIYFQKTNTITNHKTNIMKKKLLIPILVWFCAFGSLIAQTTTENYIKTTTYQDEFTSESAATTAGDKIESVTYFDGLGRPKQSVAVKASPDQKDLVTPITYDDFGRQDKEYLPYEASTNNASYKTDAFDAVLDFYDTSKYQNTANPYSEKQFESSPLSRVMKQAAPGAAWGLDSGNEIGFAYVANTNADAVTLYEVTFANGDKSAPNLVVHSSGNYQAGVLYKNITKDENHTGTSKDHTTEEFTNKQGQVILKRTYENEDAHDTHYVYDDFGNLTYVIPPKAHDEIEAGGITTTTLNQLCYQYKYDHRNRLVEKRIPGKDWEYIVYNKLDQPIMTQDANLRSQNNWLLTKYDAFGRVAYTGYRNIDESREDLQTLVFDANDNYIEYETKQSTTASVGGTNVYYLSASFPNGVTEVYTVNYYDDYAVGLPNGLTNQITTLFGDTSSTHVKGLSTINKVKVLATNDWITTVTYYDEKGRAIYVYSANEYLDTVDIVETKYDFVGKVLKTRATHTKGTADPIVTQDVFTYDHMGRLIDQHQCIGDDSLSAYCGEGSGGDSEDVRVLDTPITTTTEVFANEEISMQTGFRAVATSSTTFTARIVEAQETGELIAHNTYDALGQLERKKVGNNTSNPLQTVDYQYNIRGWLTHINDPNTTLTDDLFAFKINYNTPEIANTTPLYNGNISETHWKTKNDHTKRHYYYTYDALNRITAAISNGTYDLFGVSYDKMGNIERLFRQGATNVDATTFGIMDNLTYTYSGNQLQSVSDATNNDYGFDDGNTSGTDYTYDANGNLITDANKNITSISYNHLNLPTFVGFPSGGGRYGFNIRYAYDANGNKLQKTVLSGPSTIITQYAGDYIYKDDVLQFINQPEGYIEPTTDNNFEYIYQYKDHLGNIRLSYADDNGDGQIAVDEIREEKNYYPFGLTHKGYNNTIRGRKHTYGYNGKEENDELGLEWLDYSARNYDPALGRWHNLDPHSDNYYEWSPYVYVGDNPLTRSDPDGKDWWDRVVGAAVGVATNVIPGSTFVRQYYTPTDAADYNNTLEAVDNVAVAVGTAAIITGGTAAAAGETALAVGAVATASVVGAEVGVPLAAGGATVASAGYATAAAGVVVTANAASNKAAGYNYGDNSSGNSSGSYTNTHKSGKKYHGKGGEKRAAKSANEKATKYDDPLDNTDWTPAKNDRQAFKDEYKRMQTDANKQTPEGYKSSDNYNKRQSPGKKYLEEDGQ